eukprot:GEMP01003125.1.p1 GENE.GEMP01003125.1~~GEMP01003125.1.p1  ORF type:complete len:761 (+),score=143.11 GEMP01003125.1:23-2284(+)
MGCGGSKELKSSLAQTQSWLTKKEAEIKEKDAEIQKNEAELHRAQGRVYELSDKAETLERECEKYESLLQKFEDDRQDFASKHEMDDAQAGEMQGMREHIAYLERQVKEKTVCIGQAKQRMNDLHSMVYAMEQEAKRMEDDFIIPTGVQLLVELWEERQTTNGKQSSRKPPRFLGEQWFPPLDKIAKLNEVEVFLSAHPQLCSRPHDQKPTLDSRVETNLTFGNTRIMFDSEYSEDKEKKEGKIFFSARSAMKTVFGEDEEVPDERDLPQNIVLKVWERRCVPNTTVAHAQWNLAHQSYQCPCNIEYDEEYRKSIRKSVADIQFMMDADSVKPGTFFEGENNSSLVILFHETDCFEVTFQLPRTEEDVEMLIKQKTQELSKKHASSMQQLMETQSEQNWQLKEGVEQLQKDAAQWQERYKSKELLLSKKQEELVDLKNELNKVREEMSKLVSAKGKPQRGLIPTSSSPSSDENWRLFHAMALRESNGVLFEDERVTVHMTQFFPFQSEEFHSLAVNDGKLEARVELRVFVQDKKMGFETIHLKCTNHDVSGLKVTPLPITSAERNPENEDFPPSVILQTINFELVELLQSNPWVRAEMVLCPDLYSDEDLPGIEHTCDFALPTILTKFFLPLGPSDNFSTLWSLQMHESCLVVAKTRPTKDGPWLLSLGGAFRLFESFENGTFNLGGRLLRHGCMEKDYECLIQAHSLSEMWKVTVKCADSRIAESVAAILEAILTCSPSKQQRDPRLIGLGC